MTNRLEFAHILRGLAALIVVLFAHFGGVFFAAPSAVASLTFAPPLSGISLPSFFAWTQSHGINFGHLGVALFFLISGFVIPFSLLHFTRTQFLIARFFRIWPTYVVGLSLTLIALVISTHYFGVPFPYTMEHIAYQATLIRDIVWMPSIDGVSWTLEIEIKFYVISALLFAGVYRKMNIYWLLAFAFFSFVAILYTSGLINQMSARMFQLTYILHMSLIFIVFMMIGVVFNFHHRQGISSLQLILSLSLLFTIFTMEWKYSVMKEGYMDGIKNYAYALGVFIIFYLLRLKIKTNKVLDFFADISYPLYIAHPVVGYVVMRIFLDKYPINGYYAILLAFTLSILSAYIIHIFIEKYSNQLGKKIAKRIAK